MPGTAPVLTLKSAEHQDGNFAEPHHRLAAELINNARPTGTDAEALNLKVEGARTALVKTLGCGGAGIDGNACVVSILAN